MGRLFACKEDGAMTMSHLHLQATVLPGHRVEVSNLDLPVGSLVQILIVSFPTPEFWDPLHQPAKRAMTTRVIPKSSLPVWSGNWQQSSDNTAEQSKQEMKQAKKLKRRQSVSASGGCYITISI